MEELFPAMMATLWESSKNITNYSHIVPGEQSVEYFEDLNFLHTRLMQLNSVVFIEYIFTERLIVDIEYYTELLKEYEEPCGDKIEYLLSRGSDSFEKHEALFLKEVLDGIIENCTLINAILATVIPQEEE